MPPNFEYFWLPVSNKSWSWKGLFRARMARLRHLVLLVVLVSDVGARHNDLTSRLVKKIDDIADVLGENCREKKRLKWKSATDAGGMGRDGRRVSKGGGWPADLAVFSVAGPAEAEDLVGAQLKKVPAPSPSPLIVFTFPPPPLPSPSAQRLTLRLVGVLTVGCLSRWRGGVASRKEWKRRRRGR